MLKTENMKNPKTINTKAVDIILPLIQLEYEAFYHYRSLSNWCKGVGYEKAATFFSKEAEDELTHAKALENFLVDWNVNVKLPVIESPQFEYDGLEEGLERSYDMEYSLYGEYNKSLMEAIKVDMSLYQALSERMESQYKAVVEYSDKMNMLEGVEISKTNLLLLEDKLF